MTAEADALKQWAAEKPIYLAWGQALTEKVTKALAASPDTSGDTFLKIPAVPRVKSDDSFLAKVRRKIVSGQDINSIDDRVGVRFVVLLTEQISLIEAIIQGFGFSVSKDRDYEAEREEKPLEFSYQSVHLVVRPCEEMEYKGIAIPVGTACEVQIRTLLQHAHSELTHDRLYKSRREPPRGLHRSVARSMALIEATDDIFGDVAKRLDAAEAQIRSVLRALDSIYLDKVGVGPESAKYNAEFVEALIECGVDNDLGTIGDRIEEMISEKPYIIDRIVANRTAEPLIYGVSGVLLTYLSALHRLDKVKYCWPLDYKYLTSICLDLGISIDD
ncbi:GTP pyrophosphokinase [Rhodococcus koreensis]